VSAGPEVTVVSVIMPVASIPSEVAPVVTEVTVKSSVNVPRAVVQLFTNVAPSVSGIGLVRVMLWPDTRPVLSAMMVVTSKGAPGVMEVARVKLALLAVSVPNGTKSKVVLMEAADAAPISARLATIAAAVIFGIVVSPLPHPLWKPCYWCANRAARITV
jgi:hypothetical protein